jgi:hypothetical protein
VLRLPPPLASLTPARPAVAAKTEGRRTDEFNHFKALAEASQALLWVTHTPGCGLPPPAQSSDESWQSAEFWTNKVLTQYKGKNERHVVWAAKLKELFAALRAWVKAHHASSVFWNAKGCDLASFKADPRGAPQPASGGARPPPPVRGATHQCLFLHSLPLLSTSRRPCRREGRAASRRSRRRPRRRP